MVNTRRMESSGSVQFSGHRYHTRRTTDGAQDLGSSSVSESGSEEESQGEEDSSSTPPKSKDVRLTKSEPPLPQRVRELRSRFVCNDRKFTPHHLRKGEERNPRKLPLKGRHLAVYSSRKLHNDMDSYNPNDSDDDSYSPRSSARRRLKSVMGRVERRTALSLRPLTAKSYVDRSPMMCVSDDSDAVGVRRSTRQRKVQYTNSRSWITDDQMPKKGYPNAEYSEEDSRDAQDHHAPQPRRNPRHDMGGISTRREIKKNTRYLHDYETPELNTSRRRLRNDDDEVRGKSERSSRNHRGSYDMEGKEKGAIRSSTRQTRRSNMKDVSNSDMEDDEKKEEVDERDEGVDAEVDAKDDDEEEREDETSEEKEPVENGVVSDDKKNGKPAKKEAQKSEVSDKTTSEDKPQGSKESSESDIVQRRVTRNRPTRMLDNYSSRLRGNRKVLDSSSSSEEERVYSLRERAPKQSTVKLRERSPVTTRNNKRISRRHFRRNRSPSSSDSSDSEDRPRNKYSKNPKSPHSKNEQPLKSGAGGSKVIPIGPEKLDSSVKFSSVGGLDSHIQCLKEMVLLPMMYPEVFKKFQIQQPRGVLFHGPPGTGKTLIARALANECCFGTRKISFFMRKGADLLSKWIGESEKQLRLLFEQAAEMKPSIIFFDEIDGLAPIRSSRQDQIHASIVSTLLALMDGLDSRGEVIVIGATNRIDAIDPALRRPGRFDRELFFPLPARVEREEIIKVHVSQWAAKPSDQMISYLAENSVGYCGSDLRALCSEAVIQSFRRTYPQVYNADHKLLLDPEQVKVEKVDFLRARSYLIPSSHRSGQRLGKKMIPVLQPLLKETFNEVSLLLSKTFPHGANPNLAKVKLAAGFRPAQFILTGDSPDHGQTTHLAPAILHSMEHIHAHILDLTSLYKDSGRGPEEACIQVFHEVRRNVPSVLYIPCIDQWWNLVSDTMKTIFIGQVLSLDPNSPILILATANCIHDELPEEIQDIFSLYRKEVFQIGTPSAGSRRGFFKPLIVDTCLKCPRSPRTRPKTPPELPKAPTPPPTPMTELQKRKVYEHEEHTLRELRIFLRDMCKKLANNRLFYMFTKPVDTEEVPDYPTIIKQPMDLETMMTKVDFHRYECAKDFLNDIELIVQNALEYNPARTSADKQIRHRACSLRDYAYTLIKNEMDSDFEDKCQDISKKRKDRKAIVTHYLPPFLQTQPQHAKELVNGHDEQHPKDVTPVTSNGTSSSTRTSPNRKRKLSSWQRGMLGSKKKKRKSTPTNNDTQDEHNDDKSSDESKENNAEAENVVPASTTSSDRLTPEDPDGASSSKLVETTTPLTVNCDTTSNIKMDLSSPLQSPNSKRRLSDLMSPSELLEDTLDFDDVDQALNETGMDSVRQIVEISEKKLNQMLEYAVKITARQPLQSLLDLYYQLSRIIKQYSRTCHRKHLPSELEEELKRYDKEVNKLPPDLAPMLSKTQ